jgi:hypothetical protein
LIGPKTIESKGAFPICTEKRWTKDAGFGTTVAKEAPVGEAAWNFVGHEVRADELALIRSVVGQCAGLSRDELA